MLSPGVLFQSRIARKGAMKRMTEKEAILWLAQLKMRVPKSKEMVKSIEIAISALEEIQQYRKIGTVEECWEAVEKQTQKKCAIDSCPDHTHYKCPSCGQIELSIYKHGFPRLGRITKYCENCGQALQQEDI